MGNYLDIFESDFDKRLVSSSAFQWLASVGRQLPIAPLTIFESRLSQNTTTIDFLCRYPMCHDLYLYAKSFKEQNAIWNQISQLYQVWDTLSNENPLKKGLNSAWLEFDALQPQDSQFAPSIVFASYEPVVHAKSLAFNRTLIESHLAILGDSTHLTVIKNCFAAMPSAARIYSIGNMQGRDNNALRLAISSIPRTQLLSFLRTLDWPGDEGQLCALLEILPPKFNLLSIDLDVGKSVGPKLGIEININLAPWRGNKWDTLMDILVENDLCLPEKRDALLTWRGYTDITNSPSLWGINADTKMRSGRKDKRFVVQHFFNHIKLVCEPDQKIEAKAYLALYQTWVSRQKNLYKGLSA